MYWSRISRALFVGSMLAVSSDAASAAEQRLADRSNIVMTVHKEQLGREAIDDGVAQVAVQAAFTYPGPEVEQQKLLGLLLLLTVPETGRREK